jgi:hypothetical protein
VGNSRNTYCDPDRTPIDKQLALNPGVVVAKTFECGMFNVETRMNYDSYNSLGTQWDPRAFILNVTCLQGMRHPLGPGQQFHETWATWLPFGTVPMIVCNMALAHINYIQQQTTATT